MKFVDTNILFYAAGLHPETPDRQKIARQLIRAQTDLVFSVQVFQEFLTKSTWTMRPLRLTEAQAATYLDTLRVFPIVDQSLELFDLAVGLKNECNYSYWDRAIIAAAMIRGCDMLYSEDMQHGHIINRVKIINPFKRG
jgi:predicted nucleic acid-binding protein